jgi:hypothetical protein
MKFYISMTPNEYILASGRVHWGIKRQNRPTRLGSTCMRILKKSKEENTKSRNFTILERHNPSSNCNEFRHFASSRPVHQFSSIWFWQVKGFSVGRPLKIGLSHVKLTKPIAHCRALTRCNWKPNFDYHKTKSETNQNKTNEAINTTWQSKLYSYRSIGRVAAHRRNLAYSATRF